MTPATGARNRWAPARRMRVPTGQRCTQSYDADSRRTTMLLGLGSKRKYQYDSASRLTTQIELNASNQGIYTMVDSYDAVGNRIGRATNGVQTDWAYDDAYRLIGQTKSGQAATFAYDNNSNMTTKWHQGGSPQTMQHDAADRLTTMQIGGTTTTMQWGARGVLARQYETGVIKATYGYTDINNNLRVAQDAVGLTTSTYDGDNLRRKIVAGSLTTTFVWDGSDYLQTRPSSGDSTLLIVLDGEVVGHVKGAEKRDYIVDPLGSVVAYLNDSQTLTDQFEYWPYGELIAEVETEVQPFLWVGSLGYFRDSDLRTYIRAREYRQDLGSWMQLDPLWPNQRGFAYAAFNPITLADPSGMLPVCVAPCALAAACAIDLLAVCADWSGFESYSACLWAVYEELPWWLKATCEAGIAGCILCLAPGPGPRPGAGGGPKPPLPKPASKPPSKPPPKQCSNPRPGTPRPGDPRFPPGRGYRNCKSAFNGCILLTSGSQDFGAHCLQCYHRCLRNGMGAWLDADCQFWEPDWR